MLDVTMRDRLRKLDAYSKYAAEDDADADWQRRHRIMRELAEGWRIKVTNVGAVYHPALGQTGFEVHYVVLNQYGLPYHNGARIVRAIDEMDLYLEFKRQMQERHAIDDISWEETQWAK